MAFFSPSTLEKFERFRKLKRAWWSFRILMTLFVVSLFSEVIASGSPWVVRFEGKTYFPRFGLVSRDVFLGDGVATAPDFRALDASELFTGQKQNWMLWSPIRFGPRDTVSPEQIELDSRLEISRQRVQRVSSARFNSDLEMRGGAGIEWFFPDGTPAIPSAVQSAMTQRFANAASPDLEVPAADGRFVWSLSAYTPRSRAPRSVRVILREQLSEQAGGAITALDPDGENLPDWWAELPEVVLDEAEAALTAALTVPVEPLAYTDSEGNAWEIQIEKETVQFPFRPVAHHPLGLDQSGRDVLVLILYATRISLIFGFLLVLTSMVLGTLLGGLQGYFGGRVDLVAQRLIEIYAAIPFLYAMIYLGSVFGPSFGLLLFVYAVFNWIGISYYMRAEFLKLRKQPFTEAARSLGLPTGRIMWRHILPNALVPLITFFPFSLVSAIGSLSALDFLGFGLPVGTPSWGDLLSQAQNFRFAWWLIVYPALALFAVILLAVFIGEGLRTAFDPKRETHWEA
jgi:microcin C transport system permease protein